MKKQTVIVDLEAYSNLRPMSNVTDGIHPYIPTMYMKMLKNRVYDSNLCKEITYMGQQLLSEFAIERGKPVSKSVSKYKFSRAKWYDADHRYDDYDAVIAWCTEQFGPRPKRMDAWTRWCDIHIDRIRFRDEKDYQWFILRWGA